MSYRERRNARYVEALANLHSGRWACLNSLFEAARENPDKEWERMVRRQPDNTRGSVKKVS